MQKITRRGFIKGALSLSAAPLVLGASQSDKVESLRFIHVTDSHMDLADSNSIEAMETMVSFINKEYKDLDFVLFGGDNFNNNVSGDKDAVKFQQIISKLHCPSYLVRGNKESSAKPKGDSIDLVGFKKMFVDDKGLKTSKKDWMLEKKGYVILGLDSCIENANNGLYTEETMKFAQEALKLGKPTVILNHHPYTNYWGGTEEKDIHKYVLGNTKEAQKRLFGYPNLHLTLSGHKHIDSVKEIGHVKVIATRGFVRPLDLDRYPMRYVEMGSGKIQEKLIYTA